MSSEFCRLLRLECGIQHYDWGERARDGHPPYIASLLGIEAAPGTRFAELWIGAHPELPSRVMLESGEVGLDSLIDKQHIWN